MLSLFPPKPSARRPGRPVLLGNRRTIKPVAVPFTLGGDGMWTWFTDDRAVCRNGRTYVGVITSTGRAGVYRWENGNASSTYFELSPSLLQKDDHNNPALTFTPDGRLWAQYSTHNNDALLRWRVATSADSIEAFSAENTVTNAELVSYSNTHYLSENGVYYCHYRKGAESQWAMKSSDLVTWGAEVEWIDGNGERPYIKACNNGTNRIDLFFTKGHPNQVDGNSVYHCYMQLDAGVEKFYKSDGTYISTGSVTPAQATLVWDGSTADGESWTWRIAYGSDGNPRVLFARFPTPASDHRYMHGRWTGSAWSISEITDAGPPLYAAETYYTGGIDFDSRNPNIVYLSKYVTNTWEIQEWRTADNGATWAKFRDITTGSGSGVVNGRPHSPMNHDGEVCCVWWRGRYTDFTDYDADIMGIGSA